MGKRRTSSVSRIAIKLIKDYPERFTTNYDENKKVLDELIYFPSKVLRNKVAGYIVRLKKGE
jgi:small subunit ribosomal protein S17e